MKKLIYLTSIALALFSGGVSTYGLTKLVPNAVLVVAVMGLLFEAGKLSAFALMHHKMPGALKTALLAVGVVLMTLNIVGVSGFLSSAYEHQLTESHATTHANEAEAKAHVASLERQLKAAEQRISDATAAMAKARGDRDQIRAIKGMLEAATADRNAIMEKLAQAQTTQAKTEGATIQASGEFAAIVFIANATGLDQDRVAHLVILVIASLPDLLAVLLIVAAGYCGGGQTESVAEEVVAEQPKAPKLTKRQIAAREGWKTRRRNLAKASGPKLVQNHA